MSTREEIIKKLEAENKMLEDKPVFPRVGVVYEILLSEPKPVEKEGQFGKYNNYQLKALDNNGRPIILEVNEYIFREISAQQKAQRYPEKTVWFRRK